MRADYGHVYEQLYRRHWWWRAREAIVLRELEELSLPNDGQVLDVGCGNGLFLEPLTRWGEPHGIEVDTSLLDDASPWRERIQTQPLDDPLYDAWAGSFDLVTALDVIEHVADDAAFMQQMVRLLKPGGHLMVTVPAFACLWDRHDEINQHYRRYRAGSLAKLCAEHGELLRVRYLFPSLFAPKWLVARLNQRRGRAIVQARVPGTTTSAVMTRWLKLEAQLTRRLPVPFGSSALAVLRKPAEQSPR